MHNWMEKQEDEKWEELPSPQVYDNVVCESEETKEINEKFKENLWNTPPRESTRWKKGFQDMSVLVGYPQLKYNSQLSECTVTVFTKTAKDLELTYVFDGVEQDNNYKVFDAKFRNVLKIVVKAKTGEKLELEDVDFIWNSEYLVTPKYDTKGQKGAIIEMFGWKDNDIAQECEFIGEQGYMGVKVFPHHEQVMSNSPFKSEMNPWYFMSQPVSYSLNGRMGTRDEFRQMIKTCRKHGVRVYADAVINHMTINGMDLQNHRFNDSEQYLVGEKYSTYNSPFWTPYQTYEKNPFTNRGTNCLEYPAVPYGPMDFHCEKIIADYKKFEVVTTGWLNYLADLNTESDYVRHRIADYLTDLFSIGVSGFGIEAAKHIKPRDIANILAIFKENIGGKLPEDFVTWLEIFSGSEADVLFAENGEYSYAGGMDKMLNELGFTDEDLLKVKLWWSSYPLNYTIDNGTVNPKRKVIQNDDHNSQYDDSRGLTGSGLGCILTEGCSSVEHVSFEYMLFYKPYGVADNVNDSPIRIILSSFYTKYNGKRLEGLPDGLSDCEKSCKDNCEKCKEFSLPEFPAYVKDGQAYSGEGFTRVHRDEVIIEAMQYWMNLTGENWEELPSPQVYDNVACEATEKEMNDKFKENLLLIF